MFRIPKIKILFLLLFLAAFIPVIHAQDTITLTNGTTSIPIGFHSQYYRDYTESIGLDTAKKYYQEGKFIKTNKEAPNFGITASSFWFRFTVISTVQRQWFLAFDKSRQDTIEIFCEVDGNTFLLDRGGEAFAFDKKDIPISHPLFNLFTPSGKYVTYYIHCVGRETAEFPMRIISPNAVIEKNHYLDLIDGAYMGFIILIFLYNLLIYFSTKDRVYLLYICYVLVTGLMILQFKGLGYELIWRKYPSANAYPTLFPALALIFGALFTLNFLDAAKYVPKMRKVLYFFMTVAVTSFVINLLGHMRIAQNIVQGNSFAAAIFMLVMGIVVYRKGYSPAKFYLLSWSFFLICVVIYLLKDITILPYNQFTSNAIQVGSAFEVVMLSLALGDRIRIYREENKHALEENERLVREQNKMLELKVEERTSQLQETIGSLNVQKKIVEEQNKDILDSIHYAKRIQNAILPPLELIKEDLPGSFIFYRPKDIVSGDFYWFHRLEGDKILFAVCDCTGHGVPGAFMTVIADTALNQVVNEYGIFSPAGILQTIDHMLNKTLRNEQSADSIYDGMDIAICLIDKKNRTVTFSGAMRPLIISSASGIEEIRANRFSIGGAGGEKIFTETTVNGGDGKYFYLFTDGYSDQFGGPRNKKFGKKKLLECIHAQHPVHITEQESFFSSNIEEWRKGFVQTDDMLLVGFEL